MNYFILIGFLFIQSSCFGQSDSKIKSDFNTIFVCIDSVSYTKLFQNAYLCDTVFICREAQQETNAGSYTGKYLIGESSTIEFLRPNNSNQLGDHFGDLGIEFKTRKISFLDSIYQNSKALKIEVDTLTISTMLDSLSIPWYKEIRIGDSNHEFTILEYQQNYLEELGFTSDEIGTPMAFKEFNSILSMGKLFPRQFSNVSHIKLYANKKTIKELKNFAKLTNCTKNDNLFSNGEFVIEYQKVKHLPEFPLQEIEFILLTEQPQRSVQISESLEIMIEGKKARFIFKNGE